MFGAEPIPINAIRLSETQYALKKKDNRDKGQRQFCGCMVSKDIGEYNTCPHLCEYCYANASKEKAQENYNKHKTNPLGETITGKTISSVMTDDNSAIMITELQDTENQIDANSAAIVADLKIEKN